MHFRITARTILQLGAELISSDAIAFYELIKNAFDAGSKRVTVRVVIRLDYHLVLQWIEQIENFDDKEEQTDLVDSIKNAVWLNLDKDCYQLEFFKSRLEAASSLEDLLIVLKKANYILFSDTGDGMSMDDLADIYLTIGTRNRRKQKDSNIKSSRPILGEKGLGRLSVMRLGDAVKIETTKEGETHYNILEIDWNLFSNDSDDLIDSINLEPEIGNVKEDVSQKGTNIFVYDLKVAWSAKKLREIAKAELSKFIDPFGKENREFIRLFFNTENIALDNIDSTLFKYAHAVVEAKLSFGESDSVAFSGVIDYKFYRRSKTFKLSAEHLFSVLGEDSSIEKLRSLGPFKVIFYWYNRQMLTKKFGVLDAQYIKDLVNYWGGGLMVYRDGFRVNPYGSQNDDWLALDPIALASPGYKLNRKQIVGRVEISTYENPKLADQTNREGLRENTEKNFLVSLLQHLIWKETKPFLEEVKEAAEEERVILNISDIEKRVTVGQNQVRNAVKDLRRRHPELENEKETLEIIENVLSESAHLFKVAKMSSKAMENRLKTTLDLAGLGLMVDVIGHELNRSTAHALATINGIASNGSNNQDSLLKTLKSQLITLQKRLRSIDPLGPSGRQTKEKTDVRKLIIDVIDSHAAQFERHNISMRIVDADEGPDWIITVVPGMLVQILENLISNSVYWIKQKQRMQSDYNGVILIEIDRNDQSILYKDNGPGIPRDRKDEVFRPFFSTKPKEAAGRGLGLYISQEVAKYHGAALSLMDDNSDFLNTFILNLKK